MCYPMGGEGDIRWVHRDMYAYIYVLLICLAYMSCLYVVTYVLSNGRRGRISDGCIGDIRWVHVISDVISDGCIGTCTLVA